MSSRRTRLRHKSLVDKSSQNRSFRIHRPHNPEEYTPNPRRNDAESSAIMVAAGKKADEQRENREGRTEPAPQLLTPSLIPSPVTPFTTALGLASILPSIVSSASVSLLTTSSLPSSVEQKSTLSESLASSQPTTSPVSAPVSSSHSLWAHVPPALLAVILIFVCLFGLVMFLALRRMCCHNRSRPQLASPLFLPSTAGLGSDQHQSDPLELDKQKILAWDAVTVFDPGQPGHIAGTKSIAVEDFRRKAEGRDLGAVNLPLPAHVAEPIHARRSRVLRPYVPRPYHRPPPAHTTDLESVMPLMTATNFNDGGIRRMESKGKPNGTHNQGKGKENIIQETTANREQRHQDTILTSSMHRASRPLSLIAEAVDSAPFNAGTGTKAGISSYSSIASMKRGDGNASSSAVVPQLPTAGTVAVDIGLAMLTGFSSPNIGLGFEPQSMSDSPLATDGTVDGHTSDHRRPPTTATYPGEEVVMSHFAQSSSSGSKGLAYLASDSSRSLMSRSMMRERDIAARGTGLASGMYDVHDQELDSRAEAHARLVEQLNLAIDPDPVSPSTSFKVPILPTLSEMALYRADPLYESVTNELFASYGVRMSTMSGTGQTSRASARISRMLSWFGDAVPGPPAGHGISGKTEWMPAKEERLSGVEGVQPLRIGKLRKSSG